mmetsp:Transcript_13539/g.20623  ORF Transcript_13539/g.20623 Transcript_13539/m.20623 type:complete len:218 (+) Transcript_13539:63-716(+)
MIANQEQQRTPKSSFANHHNQLFIKYIKFQKNCSQLYIYRHAHKYKITIMFSLVVVAVLMIIIHSDSFVLLRAASSRVPCRTMKEQVITRLYHRKTRRNDQKQCRTVEQNDKNQGCCEQLIEAETESLHSTRTASSIIGVHKKRHHPAGHHAQNDNGHGGITVNILLLIIPLDLLYQAFMVCIYACNGLAALWTEQRTFFIIVMHAQAGIRLTSKSQ